MEKVEINSDMFDSALSAVVDAKTEASCAHALVLAASLVQGAVLTGQSESNLVETFLGATIEHSTARGVCLQEILDRCVNVHYLPDGGQLFLWLLPVVVAVTERKLAPRLALKASGHKLSLESFLQTQFGLPASKNPTSPGSRSEGWVFALPALYSDQTLQAARVVDLIKLPHQINAAITGKSRRIAFSGGDAEDMSGLGLYFAPVVAYVPAGQVLTAPGSSSTLSTILTNWVVDSFTGGDPDPDLDVFVGSQPYLFSTAFTVGARMRLDTMLRRMLHEVSVAQGILPNGMAGIAAVYHAEEHGTTVVGVTLASRLMQRAISILNLPVTTDTGEEELALVVQVLKELGVAKMQKREEMVQTIICQHCSKMQYLHPSADDSSDSKTAPHVH